MTKQINRYDVVAAAAAIAGATIDRAIDDEIAAAAGRATAEAAAPMTAERIVRNLHAGRDYDRHRRTLVDAKDVAANRAETMAALTAKYEPQELAGIAFLIGTLEN